MSWQKVERTQSKKLDQPAPASPLGAPAAPTTPATPPTKPKTPSDKPPHPYEMTPSEAQQYRWRWVEAQAVNADDTEEQFEAAAYIIEVLHGMGVTDVPGYIGRVERYMRQEQVFNRRRLRIAAFRK